MLTVQGCVKLYAVSPTVKNALKSIKLSFSGAHYVQTTKLFQSISRKKTKLEQHVSLQAAQFHVKPLKLVGGQWSRVCWFNICQYERFQSKSEKNRANMALKLKILCFRSKLRKSGAYWGHYAMPCFNILKFVLYSIIYNIPWQYSIPG